MSKPLFDSDKKKAAEKTAKTKASQVRVAGINKVFPNRQAAIDFLRGSPGFVQRQWGKIAKGNAPLLQDVGIFKNKGQIRITKKVPFKNPVSVLQGGRFPVPKDVRDKANRHAAFNAASGDSASFAEVGKAAQVKRNTKNGTTSTTGPAGTKPAGSGSGGGAGGGGAGGGGTGGGGAGGGGGGSVGGSSNGSGGYNVDVSGLTSLNGHTANMIDPKLANGGAKLFGSDVAENQAGLQYDGQLMALRDAQAKTPLDTAQHQKDIGSWYAQVLGSLKTAGQRDAAISKAGIDSVGSATKGIASAIGGSANEGSADVAQAGAQAVGTLSALGSAQDQYNQDLSPILQAEAASQKAREGALGSSRLHDLQMQIATAVGQRGQAKASSQFAVDQANNGILDARVGRAMGITEANNTARQQNFGNDFAQQGAIVSAQGAGNTIQGQVDREVIKGQVKLSTAAQKQYAKTKKKPWASVNAAQRNSNYDYFKAGLDQNVKQFKNDPNAMRQYVQNSLGQLGWSQKNPQVAAWVRQAMIEAGLA